MTGGAVLRVLTVCTHNRTRSVVAAAMLRHHLHNAGVPSEVASAGTTSGGAPAMEQARAGLAQRHIPLGAHTSTKVTRDMVAWADLVLTAEPEHVVWIAGRWPEAFSSTFTLPEAAALMSKVAVRRSQPWQDWLAAMAEQRPPVRQYLVRDAVPGVADPTGLGSAAWEVMLDEVHRWCSMVATAAARGVQLPDLS
jgi:protein-tyrosine-phosphatase